MQYMKIHNPQAYRDTIGQEEGRTACSLRTLAEEDDIDVTALV